MSICVKCGLNKASTEFSAKDRSGRLDATCKPCRAAHTRAWAAANREKVKASRKAVYAADPEGAKAKVRAWQLANPAKTKANKDKWLEANRPAKYAASAAWRKANPGKRAAYVRARQSRQRHAVPAWANSFFIEQAYDIAAKRSAATGIKWHVDHIVPLQGRNVCGLHVEHNLQVIPARVNIRKHNKWDIV